MERPLFPVVIGVIVFFVVVFVVSGIRRGAYLSARKGIQGGNLEVPLEAPFPDCASHHHKHFDHHGHPSRHTERPTTALTQLPTLRTMTSDLARFTIQLVIPALMAVDFMDDTTNPGLLARMCITGIPLEGDLRLLPQAELFVLILSDQQAWSVLHALKKLLASFELAVT